MFTKEGIRVFHEGTHGCLDLLFDHAATLPPELFIKEVPGFGYASIRDQLAHVLYCEEGWVLRLQDLPVRPWNADEYPTIASLKEAQRRVTTATLAYVDKLNNTELNSDLTRQPKNWVGPLCSPALILQHVLTHAFHHKGQVVAMFRLLGYPAPDTDLQR